MNRKAMVKCPVCRKNYTVTGATSSKCPYCHTSWKIQENNNPSVKTYIFSVSAKKIKKHKWAGSIIIVAIAIILSILLLTYPLITIISNGVETGFVTSSRFTVSRVISIQSHTSNVSVHVPLPVNISGEQTIDSIYTSVPYGIISKNGTSWLLWNNRLSGALSNISITYTISENSVSWNTEPSQFGTLSQIPFYYLNKYSNRTDEWTITSRDPQIINLARMLRGNSTSVYQILDNIFSWEITHIQYRIGNETYPHNATTTLNLGWGKCDEMAFLFAALARDAGIPTWIAFGPLYNPSSGQWVDHAWDMSYLPLKNGGYTIGQIDPANKQFLLKDSYRFIEYIDNGNGSNMRYYYNFISYTSINPGVSTTSEYFVSQSFQITSVAGVKNFISTEKITYVTDIYNKV